MSQLIFNEDGTVSFDGSEIKGVGSEEWSEYVDSGVSKFWKEYREEEGFSHTANISRYKLKNHGEIVQFKVDCQTIAIRKASVDYIVSNIDKLFSVEEKAAKGVTKSEVLQIEYQSVSGGTRYNHNTGRYENIKSEKASDAKGATWNTLTVSAAKTENDRKLLVFAYQSNYYAFVCLADDFRLAIENEDNKKKYRLVEVKPKTKTTAKKTAKK